MSPIVTRRITPSGEVFEETFVPIYYGDTTDPRRSTAIDLSPGSNATGMNISLRNARIRSWHVRGTAINSATGMPAAGAQLRLMPREWTSTVIMPNVLTDADGHFDLKGVIPGSYVLYANQASQPAPGTAPAPNAAGGGTPPAPGPRATAAPVNPCMPAPAGAPADAAASGPPPIPAVAARLPIDVGNSNVENISITMTPGFIVRGKLSMETLASARVSETAAMTPGSSLTSMRM